MPAVASHWGGPKYILIMKRLILLAIVFATTLSLSAQRNMQVWEGNTYSEFYTNDVDSVTFLLYPEGILRECKPDTVTITKTDTIVKVVTKSDTVTVVKKDTVYIPADANPTVTTTAVTHATYNSLALGGKVVFGDYDAITERGICYATHSAPTTADQVARAGKGTGKYAITITGLTEKTHYYLRAYAIHNAEVAYGEAIEYTTPEKPIPGGGTGVGSEGSLVGKFSVSASKQVVFSKGNLQYQASTNTWRFAENQYDYVGEANENISATYDGWIDLFGWGTSGYDNTANDPYAINYQPWANSTRELSTIPIDSTQNCEMLPIIGECKWEYTYMNGSYNTYGYGPSTNMANSNLVGTSANYDWGVYNAISNGGNKAGMWRTLTYDEWDYLLNSRKNAQYLWSPGTVNGVQGLIFLPDNFATPSSISWTPKAGNFSTNTYTLAQWKTLESIGAVFLPAAGGRGGIVLGAGSYGYYWSASRFVKDSWPYVVHPNHAKYLDFESGGASIIHNNDWDGVCYYGQSVRLVQDVE